MSAAGIPVAYKDEKYMALVDPEDFWTLMDLAHELGNRWRVARSGYVVISQRQRTILLHRILMDCKPGDGVYVDHINRDPLDNRRGNLRMLTPSQSAQNLGARCNSLTGFRGVMITTGKTRRYQARVTVDGRRHHLGTFETPEEAARAAAEARAQLAPYSQEAFFARS
jgi:hypothetical protein